MSALEVQFAALTDVGRVRDQNEDNFLVDKKLGLFIVCDGMGGHAAGELVGVPLIDHVVVARTGARSLCETDSVNAA